MISFRGFSEEDLERIKSAESDVNCDSIFKPEVQERAKRISKIGAKPKKLSQHSITDIKSQNSDESFDSTSFEKCQLSLKSPSDTTQSKEILKGYVEETENNDHGKDIVLADTENNNTVNGKTESADLNSSLNGNVRDYAEDDSSTHKVKLADLQLKQRLMEEQNKKRKEMLSKALADRAKRTEEEVLRLEKIKKELQVLDGQFSQDVAVLRKKIDQACLSYADTEKHYLKIEKEFLQAKINLQKEKEKKELLSEHLCALITHNETRKAKKLETLMLQLVDDKHTVKDSLDDDDDDEAVIVDGVDERTGKMVEIKN